VDDLQQVFDARKVALLAQRFADLGFTSDELDLVTPRARRANRSGHWSQRRVIAAHGIQRNANHNSQALFLKRGGVAGSGP